MKRNEKIRFFFATIIALALFECVVVAVFWYSGPPLGAVVGNISSPEAPAPFSSSEDITLVAVGDIMLSRTVADRIRAYKNPNYPFEKMTSYIQDADIAFANLETAITPGRVIRAEEMLFRSNPEVALALRDAGFDIVSLANNHTPNFEEEGLLDTFKYLDDAGVKRVGAGPDDVAAHAPVFLTVKGVTFAFLAYNDPDVVPVSYEAGEEHPGTAFMRTDRMKDAVKTAKQKADFVIVSMHAGTEYKEEANTSQTEFAHAAIDAGAEIVIGHHPHVVQPMELYNGKYIFYSLGNFIFDQAWSAETKRGLAIKIHFEKTGVSRVEYQPVHIADFSQPHPADVQDAAIVLSRLKYPF